MEEMKEKLIKVGVLGIGGCGGNILSDIFNDLKDLGLNIDFSILNTDVQALHASMQEKGFPKEFIHQIGERSTGGLGAGSNPEVGRSAAQEDIELIRNLIADKDLILTITGLGGGTGSGAIPIILNETKDKGILTLCWFVMPGDFEAYKRNQIAKHALKEIDSLADSYIVISNDATESIIFKDSMEEINKTISLSIQIVLEVLMRSALINLDFADFTTILKNGGRGLFAFGSYDGENRGEKVVKDLTKMALQPNANMKKIQKAIVFVRGGADMRKDELKGIASSVQKKLSEDALVILGVALREGKQALEAVFLGTMGSKDVQDS